MGQDVAQQSARGLMQNPVQDVTVTLFVNAKDLFRSDPPTRQPSLPKGELNKYQAFLGTYCILRDSNTDRPGQLDTEKDLDRIKEGKPLSNWTSQVYGGKQLTWSIQDIDQSNAGDESSYTVKIVKIDKEDGADFFKTPVKPNDKGIITTRLNPDIDKQYMTYEIHFAIENERGTVKDFFLDPKLGGNN